jgi:uncharacterized protein YbjT (DUF2867 family)
MSPIKNVALIGASGALGTKVFEAVNGSGLFNVRVLKRPDSTATFPAGVDVVDVDITSVESLTAALKGQDALVSTVGTAQLGDQKNLIDAAIAAGVQRFLPSEFGSNLENPKARALPVFHYKVQVEDYLFEKVKDSKLTYTLVFNAAFLDWGLDWDFTLKVSDYKPNIYDGGDVVFSSTTLASVATAVVGVLTHPEETKNRSVRIEDIKLSQNKLLQLAKEVAPEKPWEVTHLKIDDVTAEADRRLAQGLLDSDTFVPYLFRSLMDPTYGANFEKTDNELLGLKGKTDDDVKEILKQYIK